MYILSHCENGKYAVADTDDGVIELLSGKQVQEYKQAGVAIEDWCLCKQNISFNMLRTCAYRLFSKAKRALHENDILDYIRGHIVYPLTHVYNTFSVEPDWSKGIKVFDYSETAGYYVFLLSLTNGQRLLLKVNENNGIFAQILPYECVTKYYPSGSGYLYNLLFTRNSLVVNKLPESNVFMALYSLDLSKIYLVDLTSFGNSGFNPFLIENITRQVLC